MTDIETFLKRNNLKQVDLARFLGITEGSVSKMAKGATRPSKENLRKILSNDRGWDTAPLTSPAASGEQKSIEDLKKEIAWLERRVEELQEENNRYWRLIIDLTKTR